MGGCADTRDAARPTQKTDLLRELARQACGPVPCASRLEGNLVVVGVLADRVERGVEASRGAHSVHALRHGCERLRDDVLEGDQAGLLDTRVLLPVRHCLNRSLVVGGGVQASTQRVEMHALFCRCSDRAFHVKHRHLDRQFIAKSSQKFRRMQSTGQLAARACRPSGVSRFRSLSSRRMFAASLTSRAAANLQAESRSSSSGERNRAARPRQKARPMQSVYRAKWTIRCARSRCQRELLNECVTGQRDTETPFAGCRRAMEHAAWLCSFLLGFLGHGRRGRGDTTAMARQASY